MKRQTEITPTNPLRRVRVEEYVNQQSSTAAGYFAAMGAGLGIAILAASVTNEVGRVALMLVALPLAFGGFGGYRMQVRRLAEYRDDILSAVYDRQTAVYEDDEAPAAGTRAIPVTVNGETTAVHLPSTNPLKPQEWRRVAEAVILDDAAISEKSLARDLGIVSQAQYSALRAYLEKNRYIIHDKGQNALTDAGARFFSRFIGD